MDLRAVPLVLALVAFAAPVAAQLNQPIYPAYDGYVANPDGSYTLSFALLQPQCRAGHDRGQVRTTASRPPRPIADSQPPSSRGTGAFSA